jgi:hypothetical protein
LDQFDIVVAEDGALLFNPAERKKSLPPPGERDAAFWSNQSRG